MFQRKVVSISNDKNKQNCYNKNRSKVKVIKTYEIHVTSQSLEKTKK